MKLNKLFLISSVLNDCIYDLNELSDYVGIYDEKFDNLIKNLRHCHNSLCALNRDIIRVLRKGGE